MLKQKRITSVQRIPYDLFGIVYDNLINKLELIVGSFETYVKVTMFAMWHMKVSEFLCYSNRFPERISRNYETNELILLAS